MTTPPPDQGRNPYGPPPGSGGPGPNPGWRPPYPPPGQQGQYPPPGPYPQSGPYPPPGHPGGGAAAWGGPTPPPKKDRTVLIVVASLVSVLLIGIVALVIVGSGSDDDTAATPSGTTAATPDADRTPDADGAVPEDAGDVSIDVAVGDCIRLGGSDVAAEAEAQECGSPDSNYQVIAKAATQEQCPSDVDAVYYETGRISDDETGALCLDYDLVAGDCYDATSDDIVRVDCGEASDPAKLIIKFAETVQGTSDDSVCDGFGVAYAERNFVACFADVTPS